MEAEDFNEQYLTLLQNANGDEKALRESVAALAVKFALEVVESSRFTRKFQPNVDKEQAAIDAAGKFMEKFDAGEIDAAIPSALLFTMVYRKTLNAAESTAKRASYELSNLQDDERKDVIGTAPSPCNGIDGYIHLTDQSQTQHYLFSDEEVRALKHIVDTPVTGKKGGKSKLLTMAELYLLSNDTDHMKQIAELFPDTTKASHYAQISHGMATVKQALYDTREAYESSVDNPTLSTDQRRQAQNKVDFYDELIRKVNMLHASKGRIRSTPSVMLEGESDHVKRVYQPDDLIGYALS